MYVEGCLLCVGECFDSVVDSVNGSVFLEYLLFLIVRFL
jgi:hypothetical protein